MKKYIIGFGIALLLAFIFRFYEDDKAYKAGVESKVLECEQEKLEEYEQGRLEGVNDTQKWCNDQFSQALELRGLQCGNWECKCPQESNIVALCDTDELVEDYEEMILERDNLITKLRSNITNYQCK